MNIRRIIMILCAALMGITQGMAQFNPENPPDPYMKYKVKVACNPRDAAWQQGEGAYETDTEVWISTNANTDSYKFSHWTMNGKTYSTEQSFYYTVGSEDVTFVAHYTFSPSNPDDPSVNTTRRLYLKAEPEAAASFSHSYGEKVTVGSEQYVCAYANGGYTFLGWYDGSEKLSDDQGFYYMMPDKEVTLTAKFVFNPDNPDEPQRPETLGDANNSGEVNVADISATVNHIYGNMQTDFNENMADVNGNGEINVADITGIVNIIYKKK